MRDDDDYCDGGCEYAEVLGCKLEDAEAEIKKLQEALATERAACDEWRDAHQICDECNGWRSCPLVAKHDARRKADA